MASTCLDGYHISELVQHFTCPASSLSAAVVTLASAYGAWLLATLHQLRDGMRTQTLNELAAATLGPGGGFLDNGSAFGVYSRLDLHRAAEQALAAAPR